MDAGNRAVNPPSPSSAFVGSSKNSSDQGRKVPTSTSTSPSTSSSRGSLRNYLSLSTILRNVRQSWAKLNQKESSREVMHHPTSKGVDDQGANRIPSGLTEEEIVQYQTLIRVVNARPATNTTAPRLVVITDLAKDYDDLAAMVILKELHRLGVVVLLGFIANLMPSDRRAKFGRGALNELGLTGDKFVPIARGTTGFPSESGEGNKKHKLLPHEFDCDFMDVPEDKMLMENGQGKQLLKRICQEAVESGKKIRLLLISSLEDIYTFSQEEPDLLRNAVSDVVMQGGYRLENGKLIAEEAAANNRYDFEAATKFHQFMQDWKIPSVVYSKVAAFATPLTSELFHQLAETNHKLGVHLRKVQVTQDLAFYKAACGDDPKARFAPFMDQEWYLRNRTAWFEHEHAPDEKYPSPEGDEVVPWLTKLVVYDALAAVGAAGQDAVDALQILTGKEASVQPQDTIHRVVGFAGPPSDPGIHPQQMATVISALLKGSLLACQQKVD